MAKEIKITAQNADFWRLALIARGNSIYDSIGSWRTYCGAGELRELCDEICKIRAYIDEIEEMRK